MVNNDAVKIYKISSEKSDKCYVGSTRDLLYRRKAYHKGNFKKYCQGKNTYCSSYEILDIDWDVKMELIEETTPELRKERERYWIRNLNIVNQKRLYTPEEKKVRRRDLQRLRRLKKKYSIL